MKYTLLEMTQRILESMDSDEADSISDTPESLAVANIIKECYFDIISNLDLPEKVDIFQLNGSGDSTKPCLMTLPTTVLDLDRVKYNSGTTDDPVWYDLKFVTFDDFIAMTNSLDTTETFVGAMDITENSQTWSFKYRNDLLPCYYTSFNDSTMLFDSYDSSVNATLVGAKTLCYGAIEADFTLSDSYTPELDSRQFQLLLQASKAQAFVELKQIENPKAEKKERRNTITAQRTKHAIDRRSGNQTYKAYGRKHF